MTLLSHFLRISLTNLTFFALLLLPLDDDGLLVLPRPLYFWLRRSLRLADLVGII